MNFSMEQITDHARIFGEFPVLDIQDAEFVALINELRSDEGSSVTIFSDNPDYNGLPDSIIEVEGNWNLSTKDMKALGLTTSNDDNKTSWRLVRFTGRNVLECLQLAAKEKRESDRRIKLDDRCDKLAALVRSELTQVNDGMEKREGKSPG